MTAALQRAAQVAALAILAPGCSEAAPPAPAASRFNLHVMVLDCYTRSDVRVAIDGQPLALTPPARREDSIGRCYSEPMTVGAEVRIDVQARGQTRRATVRPNAQARYLLINFYHTPLAELMRDAPLLD